jgi:hypothetical protein
MCHWRLFRLRLQAASRYCGSQTVRRGYHPVSQGLPLSRFRRLSTSAGARYPRLSMTCREFAPDRNPDVKLVKR